MTIGQLYQWLRNNPCPCDVDKAERCVAAPPDKPSGCPCMCHAKIAECHNDRRYA